MRPDDERCWAATQERDARMDGAFVVGVRTTGIYCRPSCPARALRRNMTFLDSPAAARRPGCAPAGAAIPTTSPASG